MLHFENHDRHNYGTSWCNDYRCGVCFHKMAEGKGEQVYKRNIAEVKEKLSITKKESLNIIAPTKKQEEETLRYAKSKDA